MAVVPGPGGVAAEQGAGAWAAAAWVAPVAAACNYFPVGGRFPGFAGAAVWACLHPIRKGCCHSAEPASRVLPSG